MFAHSNLQPGLQSPNDTAGPADATPTPRFLNATGRRVRSPWTATRLKKKNRADQELPGFSSDSDNETEDHDVEPQDEGEQVSHHVRVGLSYQRPSQAILIKRLLDFDSSLVSGEQIAQLGL